MNLRGYPDHLIVLNGPEDGVEFPLTRSPLEIGADATCGVHLRLDTRVRHFHARLTAVSDGYRIRANQGPAPHVEGKRVGSIRSRILRSGQTLQVGDTFLLLQCAPDGLARRSQGVVAESDFAWGLRQFGKSLLYSLQLIPRSIRYFMRKPVRLFFVLLCGMGVLCYYNPQFLSSVRGVFDWLVSWGQYFFRTLL